MKNLLSNEKEQFNLPFSSFYFVDKPIHGPNKKLLRVCFGTRHRKSMTVKKKHNPSLFSKIKTVCFVQSDHFIQKIRIIGICADLHISFIFY